MLSDFIVDMLMCICNVMCMYKEIVDILVFKFKEEFVKLFVCEGYVQGVECICFEGQKFDVLCVMFKYGEKCEQVIKYIECVSCFGCCVYVSVENLFCVQCGLGVVVVFISWGLLFDCEVCQQGVGGEVVCVFW